MDIFALLPHSLILFLTDQHVQIILSSLYVVTLIAKLGAKFIPAFRVLGLISSGMIFVLSVFQHWLKTHPDGQKIAQVTNVDEKVTTLLPHPPLEGYSNLNQQVGAV